MAGIEEGGGEILPGCRTFTAGSRNRMDTFITLRLSSGEQDDDGPRILFESPVRALFKVRQDRAVKDVLQDYSEQPVIKKLEIEIRDNHGFDFTIRARLKAALDGILGGEEEF